MMPPSKGFGNDLRRLLNDLWFLCLLVVVGIIMINFFENYGANVAASLTLIIIGALYYKRRNHNQNKLCDIQFLDLYKKINVPVLRIIPIETPQHITMYLTSSGYKEVRALYIKIGKRKGYIQKLWSIMIKKIREGRMWDKPNRGSWTNYKRPTIVKDRFQPQIAQIPIVNIKNCPPYSSVITNDEYDIVIEFDEPVRIPIGKQADGDDAMQVEFQVISSSEWKGVIEILSNIEGKYQRGMANVDVSPKFGGVK